MGRCYQAPSAGRRGPAGRSASRRDAVAAPPLTTPRTVYSRAGPRRGKGQAQGAGRTRGAELRREGRGGYDGAHVLATEALGLAPPDPDGLRDDARRPQGGRARPDESGGEHLPEPEPAADHLR